MNSPDVAPGAPDLLDRVLEASAAATAAQSVGLLEPFLREPSPWKSLLLWLGPDEVRPRADCKRQIALRLMRDIARIDVLLSRQVNVILHHPNFQRLEASWRGLRYLVDRVEEGEPIKIRVLTASWRELVKDLERSMEFDQSQLFRKVYNDEFGTPGGEPFGVLLGDYELRPRPGGGYLTDDVTALASLSQVAAAAFAPFVAAAHPTFLGLDAFRELELPVNLTRTFDQVEYLKWRALRDQEDVRFVGLVLPRVLARLPYPDDSGRADRFRFREDTHDANQSGYLWGTAVYAFGTVLIRAFAESGWLAGIRGARRGDSGGGKVAGLPSYSYSTDREGVALRAATDGLLSDSREKELADLGFIPLCQCPGTPVAAFYSTPSVQKPKTYDELTATVNARLSAMLHYMLTVARFAHYLKVLGRDKVGSFTGVAECEGFLNRWVGEYTFPQDEAGLETKARYPLRDSRVQLREYPGKPGSYLCVMHLRPHFQLDEVVTSVKLTTELTAAAR